ncbi:thiamine biosynthesis lipoprotein [Austwickia chelonae]|uniref:FAD:protein FMN transferase n=2 Tax=Austwickia TaxID=1184606 RepID=K6V6M5_9MICO|nr:ApbE family protein [Austwickia chelonae NBRC 105200]SEV91468.1 thiamine biosynthesis lipoprotein [Austwickia chelonae]
MGTVVSLALSATEPPGLSDRIGALLDGIEDCFSLHRPGSESCRLDRGELTLAGTSETFRHCHDLAMRWQTATEGVFSPIRPDGRLDLSGVVKAYAIGRVAEELAAQGLADWCLNVGGDVLVDGLDRREGQARPWTAGIVDPTDRSGMFSQFTLSSRYPALATSGTSERGGHIWSAPGVEPFVQVTVAGPDIVSADVLATAVLAGGRHTLDMACARWDVAVLAVAPDGGLFATSHFLAG